MSCLGSGHITVKRHVRFRKRIRMKNSQQPGRRCTGTVRRSHNTQEATRPRSQETAQIKGHKNKGKAEAGTKQTPQPRPNWPNSLHYTRAWAHCAAKDDSKNKVNKERFDTNQCGLLLKEKIGL